MGSRGKFEVKKQEAKSNKFPEVSPSHSHHCQRAFQAASLLSLNLCEFAGD
jgi:hypothetical protein